MRTIITGTNEDLSLKIEGFAIVNFPCVSAELNLFTMQTCKELYGYFINNFLARIRKKLPKKNKLGYSS